MKIENKIFKLKYNLESTANGAQEMMGENSLTFIPFDDPPKAVFERVVEDRFDGSDKTKVKGNEKVAAN